MGRRGRRSLLNKRSQLTGPLPAPTPAEAEKDATEAPADATAAVEEPVDVPPAEDAEASVDAPPPEDAPSEDEPASEDEAPSEAEPASEDESASEDEPASGDKPASEDDEEADEEDAEDTPAVRFVAYREMLLGWRPKPKAQRPRTYVTFAELQLAASIAALAVVMLVVGAVGLAVLAWAFAAG